MRILVKDLHPNPFRDLKHYPEKPEKVAQLVESINTTFFWDNLIVRDAPNGNGYEIAYGHNRLMALKSKNLKPPITEIDLPVHPLTNDQMMKIMAQENMEEWGATAEIEEETIRSAVLAFGAGEINIPVPVDLNKRPDTKFRIAPKFTVIATKSGHPDLVHAYDAASLSDYLGFPLHRVEIALSTLLLKEDKLSKGIDFTDLTPSLADQVSRQTRRVFNETQSVALARKIGKILADGLRPEKGKRAGVGGKKRFQRKAVTYHTAAAYVDDLIEDLATADIVVKERSKRIQRDVEWKNRQVAEFLEACQVWEAAISDAAVAISKFAPEAKRFTIQRLVRAQKAMDGLKERLSK